jgi:hypothetical protein
VKEFAVNTGAFFIPRADTHGQKVCLLKPISAIQLAEDDRGRAKLGLLSQLGPGTTVECCGDGFNDRTVKVRVNNLCYFVFLQDLESQAGIPFN